jgi:hypothetical protein
MPLMAFCSNKILITSCKKSLLAAMLTFQIVILNSFSANPVVRPGVDQVEPPAPGHPIEQAEQVEE